MQLPCLYMGLDVSVLSEVLRMCHLDTAQYRILKDSGRVLIKIPGGLGLKKKKNLLLVLKCPTVKRCQEFSPQEGNGLQGAW